MKNLTFVFLLLFSLPLLHSCSDETGNNPAPQNKVSSDKKAIYKEISDVTDVEDIIIAIHANPSWQLKSEFNLDGCIGESILKIQNISGDMHLITSEIKGIKGDCPDMKAKQKKFLTYDYFRFLTLDSASSIGQVGEETIFKIESSGVTESYSINSSNKEVIYPFTILKSYTEGSDNISSIVSKIENIDPSMNVEGLEEETLYLNDPFELAQEFIFEFLY